MKYDTSHDFGFYDDIVMFNVFPTPKPMYNM